MTEQIGPYTGDRSRQYSAMIVLHCSPRDRVVVQCAAFHVGYQACRVE
ncbi:MULTISPECIES: hypothetical protein [Achromobacter]|nr:hypothetical protein [Achromobacter marplatensis]